MRILHVIESMQMGGAERHLANLLGPLHDLGITNDVALLWSGGAYLDSVQPFARVHDFALSNRRVLPALPGLVRLARQADIVHTQLPWADIAGRLAALAARKPSVTTLQSTWYARSNVLSFERNLRRNVDMVRALDALTARHTRRFFAVSEATRKTYVTELGLRADRIEVLPNSVDFRLFDPERLGSQKEQRARIGIPDGQLALLMLARLVPPKGHADAIRAVAQLRDLPLRLYIAGSGPEEQNLRELSARLSAPVTFLGPRSDAPALLHAVDLFLFPSVYEGLPLALIEAMAMQLACLCSDIPENRETAGEHVAYAPAGDVPGIERALRALVSDPERRRQLGLAARAHVQRFSSTRVAKRLASALEEVLRGNRTRSGHVVAL
jgi:glycosyltransferase involved in cell wall biosynthesis